MSESATLASQGLDFQRSVIRLMMLDHVFCAKSSKWLKDNYFSGRLQWFFRRCVDHFEQYRRPIPDGALVHEITRQGTEAKEYEEELARIFATDPLGWHEKIKREMTAFIRANIFVSAYQGAARIYNGGERDTAYDFTREKIEDLVKVDFERDKVVDFSDADRILEEATKRAEGAIATGIFAIDEALLGGLMPQTWTTVLGGVNSGKSTLMANFAKTAARGGKRTFITVHEDEEDQTKLAYISCFAEIPFAKLFQPRTFWSDDETRRYRLALDEMNEFVRLRFMYGRESTIEAVADAVRTQKLQWDFQLYLCDYGQCLKVRAAKFEGDYEKQEYIYQELRQICLEHSIAGAGGAQVNRDGHKRSSSGVDLLRMTDVAQSWGICKKANNVITINRSVQDAEADRVVFVLDKAKSGRVPIAVSCVSDYSKRITHVPMRDRQNLVPIDVRKPE